MNHDSQELPKAFGFWSGTALVAASMIGTGILLTPGYTAAALGSHVSGLILWVVGAVLALCGALTLAEMASAIPKVGGEYVYVDRAFGATTAFTYGWATLVVGFVGPTAAVALAAAKFIIAGLPEPYAQTFSQPGCLCAPGIACALVVAFTFIHCLGQRSSAWVQTTTTFFKYGTLFAFAFIGYSYAYRIGTWGRLWDFVEAGKTPPLPKSESLKEHWNGLIALPAAAAQSLLFVTYAYVGWNGAAYVAGEAKDASRLVPRCLLFGCLGVAVLYVAIALAFAATYPVEELVALKATAESKDPKVSQEAKAAASAALETLALGSVERSISHPLTKPIASAVFGLGLVATLSAFLLTGSRVMVAMARGGHFLPLGAKWNERRNAPVAALLMLGLPTAAMVWYGKLVELLELLGTGLNALGIPFAASIFVLRRRPDYQPTFRVPFFPIPTLVYLVACVAIVGVSFWFEPKKTSISLGVIILGAPIYWAFRVVSKEERVG